LGPGVSFSELQRNVPDPSHSLDAVSYFFGSGGLFF
jgi:hypothetical protein